MLLAAVPAGLSWSQWWAIVLGTLATEDGTCIATALLIRDGQVAPSLGLAGCLVGIYVGDLLLWLLGRTLGRRALAIPFIGRRLPAHRIERLGTWFNTEGWKAVVASRFLPGTRLPMYVAAGVLGARPLRFAAYTLAAVAIWTPLLMGLVAVGGPAVTGPVRRLLGTGWIALAAATILFLVGVRCVRLACTTIGRARLVAAVSRAWRWEFWPTWLFYIPLVPWIVWLALRHRGLTTVTAANSAIPHGGFVGESKFDILSRLPRAWIVPTTLLPPDEPSTRLETLLDVMKRRGWEFPIILKPDVGERGAALKLVRSPHAASSYLQRNRVAVIAQTYHPGPFEAGIFYYRIPGEASGRIFSITEKHFPSIIGDGRSSMQALVWRHPRYRMQADLFLSRLNGQAESVLEEGQSYQLAIAGNHCQGTMFRDGGHLITPELERAVDGIARQFDGFYFGRFDVRYADVEAFRAGRGFAIVELNGATSESTNIYDPDWPLWRAYRTLFRQWDILYRVGSHNRQRGTVVTPLPALLRDVAAYYRGRSVDPVSD